GPALGDPVPPLKVFAATGPQESKELDYAAERKDSPTLYVFVQAEHWNRAMARFLKELDKTIKTDHEDAILVAVWLSDKPDETRDSLPKVQQTFQFEAAVLTCFQGAKTGPDKWGISDMAHVTVVVAHQKKVAATFGWMSAKEADVPAVREALQKAVKKK